MTKKIKEGIGVLKTLGKVCGPWGATICICVGVYCWGAVQMSPSTQQLDKLENRVVILEDKEASLTKDIEKMVVDVGEIKQATALNTQAIKDLQGQMERQFAMIMKALK